MLNRNYLSLAAKLELLNQDKVVYDRVLSILVFQTFADFKLDKDFGRDSDVETRRKIVSQLTPQIASRYGLTNIATIPLFAYVFGPLLSCKVLISVKHLK